MLHISSPEPFQVDGPVVVAVAGGGGDSTNAALHVLASHLCISISNGSQIGSSCGPGIGDLCYTSYKKLNCK